MAGCVGEHHPAVNPTCLQAACHARYASILLQGAQQGRASYVDMAPVDCAGGWLLSQAVTVTKQRLLPLQSSSPVAFASSTAMRKARLSTV